MRTNQVVLRVRGGATGICPTELLFDRTGTPYLASGWRRFCQRHDIMAGHLLIFNFDGDHQITVTVFDVDMCRGQYVAPARGKPPFPLTTMKRMTSSHGLLNSITFYSRV
jgi:hypothetical protein